MALYQTKDGTIPRNIEGPELQCEITTCNNESFFSGDFERHELSPDVWRWICWADLWVVEDGK